MKYINGTFEKLTPYKYSKNKDIIYSILSIGCTEATNDFSVDDVITWFLDSTVSLWLGYEEGTENIKNITVTNPIEKSDYKELNVLLWCGVAWDWELVWKCINKVAVLEGCTKITIRGRRGFMKRFKKYGIKEKYTIMEMKVAI